MAVNFILNMGTSRSGLEPVSWRWLPEGNTTRSLHFTFMFCDHTWAMQPAKGLLSQTKKVSITSGIVVFVTAHLLSCISSCCTACVGSPYWANPIRIPYSHPILCSSLELLTINTPIKNPSHTEMCHTELNQGQLMRMLRDAAQAVATVSTWREINKVP